MSTLDALIARRFHQGRAKDTLKNKGWSYRRAAARIGVSYQHLSEVLNGHRISGRLLSAIHALPKSKGAGK